MFVCLFVDRFVFYLNHLGTPTGIYPENFMKIPLDLAEILRIRKLDWKLFICLFVCLFVCLYIHFFCFNHRRIPKRSFPQNFVNIPLVLAEIHETCLFVCLFVCMFVCGCVFFALIIVEYPQEVSLKIW